MKLRPQQIVGLVAVIFFGAMLVWQLTQPKRDPFKVPGTIPLDSRAYEEKTVNEALGGAATTPTTAAPAADPLSVGPDDAKDDLYCSGLIFAAHRASADVVSPEAQTRRDQVIALAERGVGKLIAAGAADSTQTGAIADAHSLKASADFAADAPRIPLADCEARAGAPK